MIPQDNPSQPAEAVNLDVALMISRSGKRTFPIGMPIVQIDSCCLNRGAYLLLPVANGLAQMECEPF